jgi:hypothetical protein
LKWYEVDLNWYGIWALKVLGLAKQIKVVKLSELANKEAPAPNGRLVRVSTVAGD